MIENGYWSENNGNQIAMGYLKRALEEYNKHSEDEEKLTQEKVEKICSMMNYSFDLMSTEQAYRKYIRG